MINTSKKLTGPFLIDLRNKFQEIAGEDQLIDRTEFQNGLDISNENISNRLFDIFDKDKSGFIDISEFMNTIEMIVSGSKQDKIKFAFNVHDLDNSGFIDRSELKVLIEQSFFENNLDYDEFQLELLVNEFFKRADTDKSGTLDFGEFLDIAHAFPDFISGFAVNPINWLIPDRYEKGLHEKSTQGRRKLKSSIQVQDIGIFQWLLIPRLIFLYNILMNRQKNRNFVHLKAIHLLPSKILEITIATPDGFEFTPGDYVYVNCLQISKMEWYPFNIINHLDEGDLILHVQSNNQWTDKLYHETVEGLLKNEELNWNMRIDGPYGSSSREILETEHAILVGAGVGISRMAPILQDIAIRLQENPSSVNVKRIDLYWLNSDDHYFEWFTKLLDEIESKSESSFFNYHIHFIDKQPDEIKEKMMFISTNVMERETNVTLIDNLWGKSKFGLPDWNQELKELQNNHSELDSALFYSGPNQYKKAILLGCKNQKITFKQGQF
ncbi:MAG: hypothetical protein HOB40_06315 [Candidatus Marinimicrobia bacterium]|nr:hypothetical protein [Candidatus Neomarinimicrobiota bacterium]MBT3501469.1 hypothetical protein [Candidatus Neomarinimicrobiota bacterium]MBT3839392.1 hypothetical protein [Candidatus Neomarinimicrobiota bacterium]MBT3998893.1 hypothetical protein [Candidatus Neomarinimicrobiota bacterium]MBT4283095.1 hypothetical protein [Candidatus Neomarinimicrobiota bacterium]